MRCQFESRRPLSNWHFGGAVLDPFRKFALLRRSSETTTFGHALWACILHERCVSARRLLGIKCTRHEHCVHDRHEVRSNEIRRLPVSLDRFLKKVNWNGHSSKAWLNGTCTLPAAATEAAFWGNRRFYINMWNFRQTGVSVCAWTIVLQHWHSRHKTMH